MVRRIIIRIFPVVLLFILLTAPLLLLVGRQLMHPERIFVILSAPDNIMLIVKSLLISISAAIGATLLGTLVALALYKCRLQLSGIYRSLFLFPLLAPPYVFAVSWKEAILPAGYATGAGTLILIHLLIFFPLPMLITGNALVRIDKSMEESALILSSYRKMLLDFLFPLLKPSLRLSGVLVFIFSISDFSVPAFLGVRTLTTEIFTRFSAFYDFDMAIGQSLGLMLIGLLVLYKENKLISVAPLYTLRGRGNRIKVYSCQSYKNILPHIFLTGLLFISLLFPVFSLFIKAMEKSPGVLSEAWEQLSPTLFPSMGTALLSAFIISITGLWATYQTGNLRKNLSRYILMTGFVVPSTVWGLSLIGFYNNAVGVFIYGGIWILLIGYLGRFGFIAFRMIDNGYKQISPSLKEAALLSDISWLRRFVYIEFPLIFPALSAGFIVSYILSFRELGTSIMVYPPGMELMPVKLFTLSANASSSFSAALILCMLLVMLLTTGLILMVRYFMYKKYSVGSY